MVAPRTRIRSPTEVPLPPESLISAREAARRLGVKRATLYTYVSRGLLRRWPASDGESRYLLGEVEELKARAAAHKGHAAAAHEALAWGPPVLDSAITSIDGDGPNYRGEPALTLAERHVPWERVAELLWACPREEPWPEPWALPELPPGPPLRRFPAIVAWISAVHGRELNNAGDLHVARRLARTLAQDLGGPGRSVAEALAAGRPDLARVLNQALVLCADHELNASAFAARVASSARADLTSCVLAALATFSGVRHGGAPGQVEALIADSARRGATVVVAEAAARNTMLPGLGHPLYPEGDPRAAMLLALAAEAPGEGARAALALVEAIETAGYPAPTLDLGLGVLGAAWGLSPGFMGGVFAVGRLAGWVAHILEQRAQPGILRPRASYTGA